MKFDLRSEIPMTTSASGNSVIPSFRPVLNVDGSIRLEEDLDRDLYMEIQKEAENCDMSLILAQLSVGNTQALAVKTYGDYSKVPTDAREILQFALDAKHDFYALDAATRDSYGNSWEQWVLTHEVVEAAKSATIAKETTIDPGIKLNPLPIDNTVKE